MTGVLLIVVVLANFAPEFMPGSISAWQYVWRGIEASVLWWVIVIIVPRLEIQVIAAYGFLESIQRPVCRLMFAMDQAPNIPRGTSLCEVAGLGTFALSPVLVALTGLVVAWCTQNASCKR